MDFDFQWLLLALPVAFALGWLASRLESRQWRREVEASPKAYFKGLNLLLNEQQDKAIDAFIEAVQHDPDSSDLHFALGNLFRRRGDYERAVRVHQHLIARGDLPASDRDRAQHALAQDFLKAGLFDRAEAAYRELEGTAFATNARLALLSLYERSRDWKAALDTARELESSAAGSFADRMAHYWCELALEADARGQVEEGDAALARAREVAPLAARPLVLAGQRLARRADPVGAMAAWSELARVQPDAFSVVAAEFATSAQVAGSRDAAVELLARLARSHGASDVLTAWMRLVDDPDARRSALLESVQRHPALGSAQALLNEASPQPESACTQAISTAMSQALKPLRRYRCAACGFEAQHYFWQCPGCQGWDTYPPRRLDDH